MSCSRAEALEIVGTGGQRRTPSVPLPLGVDQRVAAKRGDSPNSQNNRGPRLCLAQQGTVPSLYPKLKVSWFVNFFWVGKCPFIRLFLNSRVILNFVRIRHLESSGCCEFCSKLKDSARILRRAKKRIGKCFEIARFIPGVWAVSARTSLGKALGLILANKIMNW